MRSTICTTYHLTTDKFRTQLQQRPAAPRSVCVNPTASSITAAAAAAAATLSLPEGNRRIGMPQTLDQPSAEETQHTHLRALDRTRR